MRARTVALHTQAERSGVIAAILSGTTTQHAYALYLRNLLPAYQQLQRALQHHRGRHGFAFLAQSSLHRAERIAADLNHLAGPSWANALPLLPAGEEYAACVRKAALDDGALLLAHVYTRYLGDLSGGQIIARCLTRLFGAGFRATTFTEFPAADTRVLVTGVRAALDEAGSSIGDPEAVAAEAVSAFEMNIRISVDVGSVCGRT
jgi:heme oxygenase